MAINNVNNNNNKPVDNNTNTNKADNNQPKEASYAGLSVKKADAAGTKPLSLSALKNAQDKASANKASMCKPSSRTNNTDRANNTNNTDRTNDTNSTQGPNGTNSPSAPSTTRPTSSTSPSAPSTSTSSPINASTNKPFLTNNRQTVGTNQQLGGFLQNILNLKREDGLTGFIAGATRATLNASGQTKNATVALNQGGSVTLFDNNGSFPPSSTATLPRNVFDQQGILSFYKSAGPLSPDQLKGVQNAYAGPNNIASRANYAANLVNLGKNLTAIQKEGNLDDATNKKITDTLGSLRKAYNTLADRNAPAPDPRALYSQVADAYDSLSTNGALSNTQQQQVSTGLNILSISASNYDTNRLPVPGAKPPATPPALTPAQQAANAAAAAKFPLPSFDSQRSQPLTAAQSTPQTVFGDQVSQFLQQMGIMGIDPNDIDYQVNSADQLQSIQVQLNDGRRLTALFNMGMIDINNAKTATV